MGLEPERTASSQIDLSAICQCGVRNRKKQRDEILYYLSGLWIFSIVLHDLL